MREVEKIQDLKVLTRAGRTARFNSLALVAIVALVTASCDAVTVTDPITLQAKTVSFRFEFDTDGVDAGDPVEAQSVESIDMGPLLDDFTKAEVLSADVTSVELERISPASVDLDFIDQVQLALTASGISARTIASSSSLPASRNASLSLGSTDATAFVVAPTFRAVAEVVPATVPAGGFVLRANVTLRIQVEGV